MAEHRTSSGPAVPAKSRARNGEAEVPTTSTHCCGPDGEPVIAADQLEMLLGELEAQAVRARQHEERMQAGLLESDGWSSQADRDWIAGTAADATRMRTGAEARLAQGRAIVEGARRHGRS